ncbi:endonuclease domain-containing protein [Micromonospora rubida]|uniref:Endonuclease domain-containing protein n=1 Tax=Micromonospora rubida TaxID=2697657 RepID=A0ABW7SK70_9ACTN
MSAVDRARRASGRRPAASRGDAHVSGRRPAAAVPLRGDPDTEHLDHDHRAGSSRGILCFNCNGGLGQFRDSPTRLARAITYLRGTTWQRALIHPGVYQMCSPTRGRPPSRHS